MASPHSPHLASLDSQDKLETGDKLSFQHSLDTQDSLIPQFPKLHKNHPTLVSQASLPHLQFITSSTVTSVNGTVSQPLTQLPTLGLSMTFRITRRRLTLRLKSLEIFPITTKIVKTTN